MKKHFYRTLGIWVILLFTAIWIYPTIGSMFMSDEAKEKVRATIKEEDSVYTPPSLIGDMSRGIRRWAMCDPAKVVNLGLDLKGGVHMVIGFELTAEQKAQNMTDKVVQEMVLQRIRRRVAEFEASDPTIQALGTNRIQVQLPGEKDVDRAKNLIMKTAYLTFNGVAGPDELESVIAAIGKTPQFEKKFTPFLQFPKAKGSPFRIPVQYIDQVRDVVREAGKIPGLVPADKVLAFSPKPNPWDDQEYELYLIVKKPLMDGSGLTRSSAQQDDDNPGKFMILFEFDAKSANQFGEITDANLQKPMAIVLDDVVCSAPTIQSRITSRGQITGNFSQEQARDLSIALNSGSMPVPVREEYTGVIGPSLGGDSIHQGVVASLVGLILVLGFMIYYYRFGGLIACIALFLNALILTALFAYFRLTLTLPGIAGFVLTLGMAVDANVLIFERVREEVRNGKSLIAAIEQGYERAAVTIMDANVTTLIAALVLLQFGTGPVQGFGVALSLGILTSVFTALLVSKAIFDVLIAKRWVKKLTMVSWIPEHTKIPFIGIRNKCFIFSIVVTLIGMACFFGRGYENNFGVDFASGTNIRLTLDSERKIDIAEVRGKLEEAKFENISVQEYGTGGEAAGKGNKFVFRTTAVQEQNLTAAPTTGKDIESRVRAALAPLCGSAPGDYSKVALDSVESVGPAIGMQLRVDALKAIFWAFVFQTLYMWFRYSLVYGITAIIALIHDTLICTGILVIFGGRIDMNVVAAILTIIGYSVNDTVVVYDRIREIQKLYAGRGMTLAEIMNLAINQTLSRTVLTSFVTLLTVIALYFFGGEVLRDFSFYLIAGILFGTYSSIFVASALAYVWQEWEKRRKNLIHSGPAKPSARKRPVRTKTDKPEEAGA